MIHYLNCIKKNMKVEGKRILCIVLSFAIFCFSLFDFEFESYAAEKDADNAFADVENRQSDGEVREPDIDREEAKEIADFQVSETIEKGETDWKNGTEIKRVYSLCNQDKEIQAYAVELKRGPEDAGYVVVGANEENPPIIEFRTSGKFLDEGLQSDEYLLYDGSINYYKVDEVTNQATNIENPQESFSVEDIQVDDTESNPAVQENKNQWEEIRNQTRNSSGGSTPPTEEKQGKITNPLLYEKGYTSITNGMAPDAILYQYFAMSDLSNKGGVCTPTAVVNLFKYYTERKRLRPGLSLWCQNEKGNDAIATFNKLASYFKTVLTEDPEIQGGTFPSNVKPGLDKYFRELGLTATDAVMQYHDTDETVWSEMKHRIDFGDPFIYCVNGHYTYKNHAVLAVGYVQYNYDWYQENSRSRSSHYLLVVDGYSKHADRYINVDVGHSTDEDEMVTLYFRYSYGHK